MKYFKNTDNELFINPIVKNHIGLIELTKEEFDTQLELNNKPTDAQILEAKVNEYKSYLASTDYKMTIDYFATLTKEIQDELILKRVESRDFIRANS